ncbi:hypothetical protein [Marinifilum flexuosum]|uniref:SH3 domain-containing protein n=1 Tax=Marinifilum flexuosum TaxID=1117708 RepID=A0A419X8P2_9BACT|nr:hypothetical protein [Marinifilum flexuosum]RKE04072.1 hypothetical protein BXY64_1086 [Marinifilum flexuosum]
MRRIIAFSILLLTSCFVKAQHVDVPASFKYLKYIEVDDRMEICAWDHNPMLFYNENITNLIQKQVLKGHPLYFENAEYFFITDVARSKIDYKKDEYYRIIFSSAESCDPMYSIYKETGDSLISMGTIECLDLFVPGNGYLYCRGHANTTYNKRKKYKLVGDQLVEVKQPYYHVGIRSEIIESIVLYTDKTLKEELAKLPKGAEVEVLLNEDEMFLVKTSFGLVGWWKPESLYPKSPVPDLYFRGD